MRFRILDPLEAAPGHRLLELGRPEQRVVLAIPLPSRDRAGR
ncbi:MULTISPECIES: hypothetical protein [unclassified Geodermatophilus]